MSPAMKWARREFLKTVALMTGGLSVGTFAGWYGSDKFPWLNLGLWGGLVILFYLVFVTSTWWLNRR